jgi:hypothetical protein
MQAIKRRVTIAGAAVALGLLAPLAATAPPAAAGTGVGCGGSTCSVDVWKFVSLTGSGDKDHVFRSNPINVPPPPCLWNPIGDATTGSQYIIGEFGDAGQGTPYGVYDSVQQAKKLVAAPKPGTWYMLPINPAAGQEGAKKCLELPLFAFEPPGVAPPMPNVPGVDLADFAYNHMRIPTPHVTTDPVGKNWVNLATFVRTGQPATTRTVTATLGAVSATVTAIPSRPKLTASGAAQLFTHCGPSGSRYATGKAPNTGAGTPPDCGVLWRAPTTSGSITATVTWQVTWTSSDGTNGDLPAIVQTDTLDGIQVAEIQSING